jgi:glycosyltransferase involved in cell wall biosynthesis
VAALRSELELRDGVPVVGVIARRKSQDELLRAIADLDHDVEILFVGIELDDELRALAAALPAGRRVRGLGFRDDVADLSALLDVFVLPSRIEGFSLALLEAMARGIPCIASDEGGNREALADDAGLLYPVGDVPALRAALARLLDDPAAARARGERARARAFAEFDVARTVERTEALYRRLLEER